MLLAGVDVAVTKARILALNKAIAKATKEIPTEAVSAAQLALEKEVYLRDREEKLLFVEKGAALAKENFQKAWDLHRQMAKHWAEKLEAVEAEEVARQESFAQRNLEHEDRHRLIVEEYDKRIAAAHQISNEVKAATPPPQLSDEEKKTAAAEEVAAQAAKDAVASKAVEKAAAVKAFAQLETTAVVDRGHLPVHDTPPDGMKVNLKVMQTMYHWARASTNGDAYLPFNFTEMGATTEMARDLVGPDIWSAFFQKQKVLESDVCPMQLRQLVFLQLMEYDTTLRDAKCAEQEKEAQRQWTTAGTRLKALKVLVRQGPY